MRDVHLGLGRSKDAEVLVRSTACLEHLKRKGNIDLHKVHGHGCRTDVCRLLTRHDAAKQVVRAAGPGYCLAPGPPLGSPRSAANEMKDVEAYEPRVRHLQIGANRGQRPHPSAELEFGLGIASVCVFILSPVGRIFPLGSPRAVVEQVLLSGRWQHGDQHDDGTETDRGSLANAGWGQLHDCSAKLLWLVHEEIGGQLSRWSSGAGIIDTVVSSSLSRAKILW